MNVNIKNSVYIKALNTNYFKIKKKKILSSVYNQFNEYLILDDYKLKSFQLYTCSNIISLINFNNNYLIITDIKMLLYIENNDRKEFLNVSPIISIELVLAKKYNNIIVGYYINSHNFRSLLNKNNNNNELKYLLICNFYYNKIKKIIDISNFQSNDNVILELNKAQNLIYENYLSKNNNIGNIDSLFNNVDNSINKSLDNYQFFLNKLKDRYNEYTGKLKQTIKLKKEYFKNYLDNNKFSSNKYKDIENKHNLVIPQTIIDNEDLKNQFYKDDLKQKLTIEKNNFNEYKKKHKKLKK